MVKSPRSPTVEVHEAIIPAPLRGCGWLLIIVPFVELVSAITYHVSTLFLGDFSATSFLSSIKDDAPTSTKSLLYILGGIVFAAAATKLQIRGREFRMRRMLITNRVELNRLTDLWFYPAFPEQSPGEGKSARSLSGSYCLEGADGSSIQFKVVPSQLNGPAARSRFIEVIGEVERISGKRWTTLVDPLARRHLPELQLLAQLERVTGRRGWSLAGWLLQSSVVLQLSRSGVVNTQALVTIITLWTTALAVLAMTSVHAWRFALAVVSYMGICLSMNLLVLMISAQRRERQAVQGELLAGSEIQRQLLPKDVPTITGFDLSASYVPAREIAGDYWDVLEIATGRWALVIADVAGKGAPAALVASLAKGHLAASLKGGATPLDALDALNREIRIAPKRRGRLFVTMILLILDEVSGSVSLVRAGHEPPLLLRHGGTVESIEPRGLAIGIDPGDRFRTSFDVAEIDLRPHDSLVLFTDGLTEAMNPEQEQFGITRLENLLKETSLQDSGAGILDAITSEVDAFRSGAEPSDDITLLVLHRTASDEFVI